MTAVLYPVAHDAEEALAQPLGRAARERLAAEIAQQPVRFVTEAVGAAFASREAALDFYKGRLDDERPGRGSPVTAEDRYCQLREVLAAPAPAPPPVEPSFAEGRRWPRRKAPPPTAFRLSVSYWRIGEAAAAAPLDQARNARRRADAAALSAGELRALAQQPLRPVRPQQPLEIGLFENPAPEAPHILIPDD
jgi:hypothetical protein